MYTYIYIYIYIYIHSGAYDCLIGGYIDYGLSDLTGMVSEQVVLRESHLGYHETTGKLLKRDPKRHEERNEVSVATEDKGKINMEKDSFWNQLHDFSQHGSLMGCSIQPDPKAKNAAKVEAKVGFGLHQRHAYSITGVYEVEYYENAAEEVKSKTKSKPAKPRNYNMGVPIVEKFYNDLAAVYERHKKVVDVETDDDEFIFKETEDVRNFVFCLDLDLEFSARLVDFAQLNVA